MTAALKAMLPWLTSHVEQGALSWGGLLAVRVREERGDVTDVLRYHFEQGLSKRMLEPKELFAPESLEAFKI